MLTTDLPPHKPIMPSTSDRTGSTEPATSPETKNRSFGPVHIIEPKSKHTHTAVMLHGRGSTGPEFAEELLDSALSDGVSLSKKLPGCRWVFPSSQHLWSTMFQEDMPAWFEAHSLTDITARQDLQVGGVSDSVDHVTAIVREEIRRLDGKSEKLLLGGISQGGAVALWTLLCQRDASMRPGAFVVVSTWLPFAANIERTLTGHPGSDRSNEKSEFDAFVERMIAIKRPPGISMADDDQAFRRLPPVFIGHGVDDAYVDIELGRQVARILVKAGLQVEWREYSGAEEEGHWFKVPEEMDDVLEFLGRIEWIG